MRNRRKHTGVHGMKMRRKKWKTGAVLAMLGLLLLPAGLQDVKASGDQIYTAGMPDAWPLEYYEDEKYQGILPELLEEAAQSAGVSIHYVEPSREDRRLSLAGNEQVDVIWSYGLSKKELSRAGLEMGDVVLAFQEEGKRQEIHLAYSKSMPPKIREQLEERMEQISPEEVDGKYYDYAVKGQKSNSTSVLYRYILPVCLAAAALALVIMPLILAKRKRQIEALAYLDDVTKKGNFAVWKRKYSECIRDGNREHYAVLYLYAGLDIVSQIYGYEEGNDALRLISNICMEGIDESTESVSRFNEFCFVFFVQYTSVEALKQRVVDMEQALEEAFQKANKRYFLELHAGIYRLTGADSDPMKTLQYSEIAMQYARSHYLQYALYDEFVEQETISGYAIGHEAIHGLMHQEFVMYLQPVVDLKTGRIRGAEALARWENPNRGLLSPEKFLKIMKKKQLVGKMNMEIFRQGCRFLHDLNAGGTSMRLVFNFTVENVGDENFAEQLYAVAGQYEVDPGQIVVQLNQMVEITRSEVYMKTIRQLREYGFDVCLAGLELDKVFLEYLDCGVNSLKMRQELVRQIETPEGYKVIQSLTGLCSELGLVIFPVGVENERQAELLEELGCEIASGYYYYYPMNQKSFVELMKE